MGDLQKGGEGRNWRRTTRAQRELGMVFPGSRRVVVTDRGSSMDWIDGYVEFRDEVISGGPGRKKRTPTAR